MDPLLAPTMRGLCCPRAPPSDDWYGGLGVSLGNFEACKPQKVGGCGWVMWPPEFGFEPRSPRYGPFLFQAGWTQTAHIQAIFGHFWAVSPTYRGARGQQKVLCQGAIEAHVECTDGLPSFGRFEWVLELFLAKKGCFGAENAQFWEGTSRLGAPAPGRHR